MAEREHSFPISARLRGRAMVLALVGLGASPLFANEVIPDPFTPPASLSRALPERDDQPAPEISLTLQATHVSRHARYAVINGKRLETGDYIGDAELVSIDPASVSLRNAGGAFLLRFSDQGPLKQPVGRRE